MKQDVFSEYVEIFVRCVTKYLDTSEKSISMVILFLIIFQLTIQHLKPIIKFLLIN